jgi:hypothetical protein
MSPPQRQSVARISEELGIHVITLYKWRKTWRLQGEAVPAFEKHPDGWSAADKFTVVLETAGLKPQGFCVGEAFSKRSSTPLSSAPTAASAACSLSRGTVGGRQPRMPTPSRC